MFCLPKTAWPSDLQRNMVFVGDEVLGNTTMTKKLAPVKEQVQ